MVKGLKCDENQLSIIEGSFRMFHYGVVDNWVVDACANVIDNKFIQLIGQFPRRHIYCVDIYSLRTARRRFSRILVDTQFAETVRGAEE